MTECFIFFNLSNDKLHIRIYSDSLMLATPPNPGLIN